MKKAIIAMALAISLLGSAYFVGTALEMNNVTAEACDTINCN